MIPIKANCQNNPRTYIISLYKVCDTELCREGYPLAKKIVQDINCILDNIYPKMFEAKAIVTPLVIM